jgi:hypothetical protein
MQRAYSTWFVIVNTVKTNKWENSCLFSLELETCISSTPISITAMLAQFAKMPAS